MAAGEFALTPATSAPELRFMPEAFGDFRGHVLQLRAEPGPLHGAAAAPAEATTTCTMLTGIAKPMPCEPPEREKIAVLMPTSLPGQIDQRAAGIAGIDRGVGLDEELIIGDADLGARQRRHDAMRHGLPDAERIADRQHQVADLQIVGIAELDGGKALLRVP